MQNTLVKPEFIKISDIRPGVHCYHIYAKIVSAGRSQTTQKSGKKVQVVEGVLADDSGCANFRFCGAHAMNLTVGSTVAVRNGRSNLVDGHLLLELDQFGRVNKVPSSPLKQVNVDHNISNVFWEA